MRVLFPILTARMQAVHFSSFHRLGMTWIPSRQQPKNQAGKGLMAMIGMLRFVGVFVCACLFGVTPAAADVVTDWNAIARNPLYNEPRPGPTSILDHAMMHVAMHDAIQAIEGRFQTYSGVLAPSEGSVVAAAASAAHAILVNRYPSRESALNAKLTEYLGVCDASCVAGVAVGQDAADAIILMRQNDGAHPSSFPAFMGGTNPGEWRPTSAGGMVTPWLGGVTPFTVADITQFLPEPPPPMTSREYARDYNEVKLLGRIADATHPSARTPDQEAKAMFFREGPPPLWNRTLEFIVVAHVPDTGDRARLYALVQLSMADAIITAWHDKKHFNFWRPETAIREGHLDGNPNTVGDPSWVPHTGTPNYPDYTSGANNLTGAVTGTLEHFFQDDTMPFKLYGMNGTRDYESFSAVADDVCEARILQGIHFRFADSVARTQGRNVAKNVFQNFLRPLNEADDQ